MAACRRPSGAGQPPRFPLLHAHALWPAAAAPAAGRARRPPACPPPPANLVSPSLPRRGYAVHELSCPPSFLSSFLLAIGGRGPRAAAAVAALRCTVAARRGIPSQHYPSLAPALLLERICPWPPSPPAFSPAGSRGAPRAGELGAARLQPLSGAACGREPLQWTGSSAAPTAARPCFAPPPP